MLFDEPEPVVRAFDLHGALVAVFADGRAVRVDPAGHGDTAMPASLLAAPEAAPEAAPADQATTVAR